MLAQGFWVCRGQSGLGRGQVLSSQLMNTLFTCVVSVLDLGWFYGKMSCESHQLWRIQTLVDQMKEVTTADTNPHLQGLGWPPLCQHRSLLGISTGRLGFRRP